MEAENNKPFTIRSYRPSDREAVRKLCCETGFLGEPIDPVYEDRELFADFLTTYYTDHEPESCFLLEIDGTIRGYLLGSRYPFRNQLYAFAQNIILFFRALLRYARYHSHSRRFFRWVVVHGWREVPAAPRRVPTPLLEQLAPGGRLVLPVGPSSDRQELQLWRRLPEGGFDRRTLMQVRFVPLTGSGEQGPH